MATLSKSGIDPVASVKAIVQGAFVEWAMHSGSYDWGKFVHDNSADLVVPIRLALAQTQSSTAENLRLTTHSAGLLQLCIQFDMVSGFDRALRERLLLIKQSREHEVMLAQENQLITGSLLSQNTRLRLAGNIDKTVTLLSGELDQLQVQMSSDIVESGKIGQSILKLEEEAMMRDMCLHTELLEDEEDVEWKATTGCYRGLNKRLDLLNRRRSQAVTRTMELTSQLQSTILAFDQLNTTVVGMVDATFNYANPEINDEFSQTPAQSYLQADVYDDRRALQAGSE